MANEFENRVQKLRAEAEVLAAQSRKQAEEREFVSRTGITREDYEALGEEGRREVLEAYKKSYKEISGRVQRTLEADTRYQRMAAFIESPELRDAVDILKSEWYRGETVRGVRREREILGGLFRVRSNTIQEYPAAVEVVEQPINDTIELPNARILKRIVETHQSGGYGARSWSRIDRTTEIYEKEERDLLVYRMAHGRPFEVTLLEINIEDAVEAALTFGARRTFNGGYRRYPERLVKVAYTSYDDESGRSYTYYSDELRKPEEVPIDFTFAVEYSLESKQVTYRAGAYNGSSGEEVLNKLAGSVKR